MRGTKWDCSRIRYSGKTTQAAVARKVLRTEWAVNANWNSDGWNVNANSVANQNRWNADNQVLSKFFLFKDPDYRVFVCRNQPPSILPISFNDLDNATYLFISRASISQAICRRNLRRSKVSEAFLRYSSFVSLFLWVAAKTCSIVSRNILFILIPIV